MYDREIERTYDASNEGDRLLYTITFFPWYFSVIWPEDEEQVQQKAPHDQKIFQHDAFKELEIEGVEWNGVYSKKYFDFIYLSYSNKNCMKTNQIFFQIPAYLIYPVRG